MLQESDIWMFNDMKEEQDSIKKSRGFFVDAFIDGHKDIKHHDYDCRITLKSNYSFKILHFFTYCWSSEKDPFDKYLLLLLLLLLRTSTSCTRASTRVNQPAYRKYFMYIYIYLVYLL